MSIVLASVWLSITVRASLISDIDSNASVNAGTDTESDNETLVLILGDIDCYWH